VSRRGGERGGPDDDLLAKDCLACESFAGIALARDPFAAKPRFASAAAAVVRLMPESRAVLVPTRDRNLTSGLDGKSKGSCVDRPCC